MAFKRFTERATRLMKAARENAVTYGSQHLGIVHLLLAIVQNECEVRGVGVRALMVLEQKLPAAIAEESLRLLGPKPATGTMVNPQQTDSLRLAVQRAMIISDTMKMSSVGTEHLLLGMLQVTDDAGEQLMKRLGVSYDDLHAAVYRIYREDLGERRAAV